MLRCLLGIMQLLLEKNSAVTLLEEMELKCAGQVLDPTLLLDKEEWMHFIHKEIQGRYVLVYQIHNNPILDRYAMKFAKHVGLPLYRVSPSLHQIMRGGKFIFFT